MSSGSVSEGVGTVQQSKMSDNWAGYNADGTKFYDPMQDFSGDNKLTIGDTTIGISDKWADKIEKNLPSLLSAYSSVAEANTDETGVAGTPTVGSISVSLAQQGPAANYTSPYAKKSIYARTY
jgi:hypothetical protein